GINLGAFLCAFVCGTLGEKVGWHWGFGSAAVGMIAGLAMYLVWKPQLLQGIGEPPSPEASPWSWLGLIPTAILISAVVGMLYQLQFFGQLQAAFENLGQFGNAIVGGILLASVVAATIFTMKQQPEDRGPTASIFIFLTFNIFFWLAFEQAGSSMN